MVTVYEVVCHEAERYEALARLSGAEEVKREIADIGDSHLVMEGCKGRFLDLVCRMRLIDRFKFNDTV